MRSGPRNQPRLGGRQRTKPHRRASRLARAGLLNSAVSLTALPGFPWPFHRSQPRRRAGLADRLQLGRLHELRGIGAGIENTNYFPRLRRRALCADLFERLTREQLPSPAPGAAPVTARGVPVPLAQG